MTEIIGVRFRDGGKQYYFDPAGKKVTKGQKVNEISEQLNLSPKTVNSYRYRMFSKLNIHGDVELTHLAIRHGLCNAETLSSQ